MNLLQQCGVLDDCEEQYFGYKIIDKVAKFKVHTFIVSIVIYMSPHVINVRILGS